MDTGLRRISVRSIAEGGCSPGCGGGSDWKPYCDDQEVVWKSKLPSSYTYRSRFSPGYGDWALEEQEKIFRLLHCAKTIGLTLTTGGIMAPTKSVTAVIGIDETGKESGEETAACGKKSKCSSCSNVTCPFRQEEL